MCRRWGRMGARLALPRRRVGRGARCRALAEGPLYHPIVVVGIACGLQLTLAERILAAASSWPSSGSLASSSWLGSHAAHGLGRESQRRRHGWDHTRSASERRRAAGSSLSGSCVANLRHRGGQGLMPLVAGVDAAALLLLSPLQWSCLPSPYAPRRREDGEHDGAKEGAWRSSSASAVAGVVCWRMPVMCRLRLQAFVAAVGKYQQWGRSRICAIYEYGFKKKQLSRVHLLIGRVWETSFRLISYQFSLLH